MLSINLIKLDFANYFIHTFDMSGLGKNYGREPRIRQTNLGVL